MPFGKHKNKPISSVPSGYLRWAIDNIDGRELLKIAMYKELQKRESTGKEKA